MNQVKGFAFSFLIVIILFLVSAIAAGLLADLVGVWKKPVIGSVAAFCVVISGYVTAPSHKKTASVVWLIVGAIAAWVLAGNSYYPEDYEHAYQPTLAPLLATYLSGLIALWICMVWHKKHT
jgi:MFS family permease